MGQGLSDKEEQHCLFLNNGVPKWKGQDSWCLLKCYNALEHTIFLSGKEREASRQDLLLELSVYQAGAGVGAARNPSPKETNQK